MKENVASGTRVKIAQVIKMTGVSRSKLVNWEERGYIVPTWKTHGMVDHRLYDNETIERIHNIKELIDMGFRLSVADDMVTQGLTATVHKAGSFTPP